MTEKLAIVAAQKSGLHNAVTLFCSDVGGLFRVAVGTFREDGTVGAPYWVGIVENKELEP